MGVLDHVNLRLVQTTQDAHDFMTIFQQVGQNRRAKMARTYQGALHKLSRAGLWPADAGNRDSGGC